MRQWSFQSWCFFLVLVSEARLFLCFFVAVLSLSSLVIEAVAVSLPVIVFVLSCSYGGCALLLVSEVSGMGYFILNYSFVLHGLQRIQQGGEWEL